MTHTVSFFDTRRSTLLFALTALGLAACGGEPSPVLLGQLETASLSQALTEQGADTDPSATSRSIFIDVRINGEERTVDLDDNLSFAIQDLPTGELTFEIGIEGISGSITLDDVQPGEVIDIRVAAGPGRLAISVVRRETPLAGDDWWPWGDGGTIEIDGHHVVHHLEPGAYDNDIVITGHHITLVGPDEYGCSEDGRAVLLGDLTVIGHHVRVVNLEVRGTTRVRGHHVQIYRPCHGRSQRPFKKWK